MFHHQWVALTTLSVRGRDAGAAIVALTAGEPKLVYAGPEGYRRSGIDARRWQDAAEPGAPPLRNR
ncbi:MAG: hypothetical protein Q8O34_05825 [Rhodocyclaceae bacterium]|nr:hypothetical protein [Rhodocyclaceae bacterium]